MTDVAAQIVLGGLESSQISKQERSFLIKYRPAGITVFSRNIPSLEELCALLKDLQSLSLAKEAYLVAIDQEGGRVARIKDQSFPKLDAALNMLDGKDDPTSLKAIAEIAAKMSEHLFQLGIGINFAPVADVLTHSENTCIGDRAWSKEPQKAALRAGAFLEGLQKSGKILGCLKHFPGQGDGIFDTHKGPCHINASRSILFERELVTFKALLQNCQFIMTSHAIFDALDTKPATLSHRILTQLLKNELGYQGIVVSDDLLMSALVQDEKEWKEALVEAIAAGCDLLLVCQGLDRWQIAIEAIDRQRKKSAWFAEKSLISAAKIKNIKTRFSSSKK